MTFHDLMWCVCWRGSNFDWFMFVERVQVQQAWNNKNMQGMYLFILMKAWLVSKQKHSFDQQSKLLDFYTWKEIAYSI